MNCNVCPFSQLCTVTKGSTQVWVGSSYIYYTTPSTNLECPLLKLLAKEQEGKSA